MDVKLLVKRELAEAVADVFSRFAPEGVMIESTDVAVDANGEEHATGPLRVHAFLPFDSQLEDTRRKLEEALWHLSVIHPLPTPEYTPLNEKDWIETWKHHYRPIAIGKRLMIVPAWVDLPEGGRAQIRIEPGLAFGTGTHPTTQLCLEILDGFIQESNTFMDVFDVGCGSGILSIAALKLGAGRAFGVDVNHKAIETAKKNAEINDITNRFHLAVGSVAEIRGGIFDVNHAPIVLANIIAPILKKLMFAGLGDIVAPGGVLILSGILEEQLVEMLRVLNANGFFVRSKNQIDDWVALVASR
ncbi:MAG TPA: 50S ribosomal protein L11 methyltransferase [Anaerolineae bacterium]|nr:50S ribosomal protein L11 methyltransferase [Anaerolineae bacterium]